MARKISRTATIRGDTSGELGSRATRACLALGLTLLVAGLVSPARWDLALWALISLPFALFPIVRLFVTRKMENLGIAVPALLTWVYFEAPYLYESLPNHPYRALPLRYLPSMAAWSALGIVAMVVAYGALRRELTPISPRRFVLSRRTLRNVFWAFVILAAGYRFLDYYYEWLLKPLSRLIAIWEFSAILALCVGLLYYLRGGRNVVLLTTACGLFIFEFLYRVADTLFVEIVHLLGALLLVYVLERRKIPWLTVVLIGLLTFPIFQGRFMFRREAVERWFFTPRSERPGLFDSLHTGMRYLFSSYSNWKWSDLNESVAMQGKTRFEDVTYLGQCVWMIEENGKKLKMGATFWWLPLTIVPRALFPWKPVNYHPTRLADEFGLRGQGSKAAMNFPMLVEGYINFGFIGIPLVCAFQGLFFRACASKTGYGRGDLNLFAFVHLFQFLVEVEANLTMIFGGLLQTLLMWWVIWVVVRRRLKRGVTHVQSKMKERQAAWHGLDLEVGGQT